MGTINIPTKKEYKIILKTGDTFETPVINGKLNSLIINSDVDVSVTIESSLGYLIFHNSQTKGTKYYAPRALLQGSIAQLIVKDQFDKFKLNESLNVRVSGPTDTKIIIILRVD